MGARRAKPPRRRAKQGRARVTVDAVVEAAARVLLREGYARATTNRIARAAGVSVGTVYQYFQDKDEIFDALLQRESARILAALVAAAPHRAPSLEQALRQMIAVGAALQPHGPELYRRLDQVPNGLLRRRLARFNEELSRLVRQILESHRSELRVDDLEMATLVVVHTVEALGYNAPTGSFDERLVDGVTDLLVRYLVRDRDTRRTS